MKNMTRAEFLATGGMAAGGVAMGCAGTQVVTDSTQVRQKAGRYCVVCEESRRDPAPWAIPSGILNSLWSDFFPRMVAESWKVEPSFTLNVGMGTPALIDRLKILEQQMWTTCGQTQDAPSADLEKNSVLGASAPLRQQMVDVINFFGTHSTFPFLIVGSDGYDFVISERGIAFYMPQKPDLEKLLQYFVYRNTGRPRLAVPGFMGSSRATTMVDAPTGPSQVKVPHELSRAIACSLTLADVPEEVRWSVARTWGEAKVRDAISELDFLCEWGPAWYLQGTVYRGLLTEMPRVIATAWLEAAEDIEGDHTYRHRLFAGHELKTILEERLETWLPERMDCRFEEAAPLPDYEDCWDKDDLMITREGLHFPRPEERAPCPDSMFEQIAMGRVGNPVFTDTKPGGPGSWPPPED